MRIVERRDISPEDWDEVVRSSPGGFVFALWNWQEMILSVDRWRFEDTGYGVIFRGSLAAVVPLTRRVDGSLASSGWGWSGPVTRGDLSETDRRDVLTEVMAELPRRADRLGAKDLFLGLPAMTDFSVSVPGGINPFFPFGWRDTSRYSSVIDFEGRSENDLWEALASDARRRIRHCLKAGFRAVEVSWPDHVDNYHDIHRETYTRTGVPPHPKAYFEGIARLAAPGTLSHLYAGYSPEGDIVAYNNTATLNGLSFFHTGCSRTSHLESGINYMLMWEAVRRAREAGGRRYEVGIVDPAETEGKIVGLTQYKSKFGGVLRRSYFAQLRREARSPRPVAPPTASAGPTTRPNTPRPGGRILVLACAYHGADRDPAPPGPDASFRKRWNGHRRLYRNFFANARLPAHMVAQIVELTEWLAPAQCELVVDAAWRDRFYFTDLPIARADPVVFPAAPDWVHMSDGGVPDAVILCRRDALGLGCGRIEAAARSRGSALYVLNGRRRFFRLSGATRARAALSRLLAETRVVETLAAALILPAAALLSVWDRVTGNLGRDGR